MNTQVKVLIGCVGALVVLSGALVLALLAPAKEEATTESGTELVLSEVRTVKVQHAGGVGDIVVQREGDDFSVEGLGDVAVSENASVLIGQAEGLQSAREITPAEDLAQFGLETPDVTAEITTEQGKQTLQLGDDAVSSSGRYALLDGKVYLITSPTDAFSYGLTDYASAVVTAPLEGEETIQTIRLTRGETVMELSYVPETSAPSSVAAQSSGDASSTQSGSSEAASQVQSSADASSAQSEPETIPAFYRLTAPVAAEVSEQDVTRWAGAAFGLSAQSVVELNADEAILEQYGLTNPETTLLLTASSGKTLELLTSAPVGDAVHLMQKDGKAIYRLTAPEVPWRTVTVDTLTGSLFTAIGRDDVTALLIEASDKSYDFAMNSGESSVNGSSVAAEAYQAVRDALFAISPQYVENVQPTLEPVVVATLTYRSGERDVLRLLPTGTGSVYLELNGEICAVSPESTATELLRLCEEAVAPKAEP